MKKKKQNSKTIPKLNDKTLVIVESPSKARTINKYLGKDYMVEASMGHLVDLPKSRMGINVNNGFEPEYVIIRGRSKIVNKLKKLSQVSKNVLLATDPDREGEAISYHIYKIIKPINPNIKRVEFNEITENAIKKALENPRDINMNLFYAQQARRILDRLVGYNISPILWQKIKKGLSAGRVQSVALRLICDREEEIQKFVPEEYWTIDGEFLINKKKLKFSLVQIDQNKIQIKNQSEVQKIIDDILTIQNFIISSIKTKERKRQPTAPYTTSKLQQDASNRLGFTSQKTMMVAQQLYEGVEIEGNPIGLITYMRTDSTKISKEALVNVREFIVKKYGNQYLSEKERIYSKTSINAQEAHEAIRPTKLEYTPEQISKYLTKDQLKLYQLIWQKFVSSQMSEEVSENTTIEIKGNSINHEYLFRASFKKVKFKGFTLVYDEEDSENNPLKEIDVNVEDKVKLSQLLPNQHFTQPPPRYTDATMVKTLEESGVGRPSTYAPTIQTLLKRYYVVRQQKALKPTELGILVNKMVKQFFPEMVDVQFTAKMEEELDQIANSELFWSQMLSNFYTPFMKIVQNAMENMDNIKTHLDEETDYICEKCGRKMLKKIGKNGYFLACSGFPDCKNAKSIPYGKCPKCDIGDIVLKKGKKKSKSFYGCTRYPECDYITWDKPVENKICPKCGKLLLEKNTKEKGRHISCSVCDYTEELEETI